MGAGADKAHEASAVSPASGATEAGPLTAQAASVDELEPAGFSEDWQAAWAAINAVPSSVSPAGDELGLLAQFSALEEAAAAALAQIEASQAEGGQEAAEIAAQARKHLAAETGHYLGQLTPDQLAELAAAHGFEHPSLVGLGCSQPHPLVHWLDPAYPAHSLSKAQIQAKANERYAALAAGATVNGLTLADIDAADTPTPPNPGGGPDPGLWLATPADVVTAQAALSEALVAAQASGFGFNHSSGLGAVIAAENKLATATCPELGAEILHAQAAAKAAVDNRLAAMSSGGRRVAAATLAEAALAEGTFDAKEATFLTPDEQLALLRASTAPAERQALTGLATQRCADLTQLRDLEKKLKPTGVGSAVATIGATPDDLVSWASLAGARMETAHKVEDWASHITGVSTAFPGGALYPAYVDHEAVALTTSFRDWAKTQKLVDLRDAAASLGLTDAQAASRAQIQNYIAAQWDATHQASAIQGAVNFKAAGPAPKVVAPSSAPSPPAASVASPQPAAAAHSGTSFAAKHHALVQALKHHAATWSDLPARPPAAEVADWTFGPAMPAQLGGAHPKSVHTAPDGKAWMFKVDSTGGARAHTEAAASEIFHRVGVPSVGVYVKTLGTKAGSIQPLITGAVPLSASPSSWSQADVDAIVRYHVAAWAVGDHDGKADNILRTPSGGLVPCDQGQAFKFYGHDRLDSSYNPNSSYGVGGPVFHQLYHAAKAGQLGPGVALRPEAALPTIKSFETLPEATYRKLLAPVAHAGVKSKLHWVEGMRKRAQKRHGSTAVTDAQIADEFLDYAVARKQGLRASFKAFFAHEGFAGAAKLSEVA